MKKLIAMTACLAFALSPALYADETAPAQVGKAAEEGANSGKSSHWGQIALAAGAITIAVVALVLVAKNKGSHTNSSTAH